MVNVLLSIIIPAFNEERYIEECILNIQRQTLKNLEIIIVDDGSVDHTLETALNFQKTDSRIKIYNQNHKGSGAARNLGIKNAVGKYIAFCDADDYYFDANSLELMIEACETNKTDICGGYRKILSDGELINDDYYKNITVNNKKGSLVSFMELQDDYNYQNFIFRKDLLVQNNIVFPDYLRYQDPPFFLKAMTAAKNFWLMPVFVYCYRYGHQNTVEITKKIKYVLMGIKDNLLISIENNYQDLYKKLIDYRLNKEYCESILKNSFDEEVINELKEISEINKSSKFCRKITLEQSICRYKEISYLYNNKNTYFKMTNRVNKTLLIYKMFTTLFANKVDISNIFKIMNINKIYVYGVGEIGKLFISSIINKIQIAGVFDQSYNRKINIKCGNADVEYSVKSPEDIPNDGLPIIVTPSAAFYDISCSLIENNIEQKRIYSLYSMLSIGLKYFYYDSPINQNVNKPILSKDKQFLITGAQFENKGAQSMFSVAVSEIRKRFPNAVIWYLPLDGAGNYTDNIIKKYNVLFLLDGGLSNAPLTEIATNLTAIIDVSGYALSSYWENDWYMRTLKLAYRYGIPLYLMPQSFGPFDFEEDKQKELRRLLPFAKAIMVREKDTCEIMKKTYNLKNIRFSNDLVLQNKSIDAKNIYNIIPKAEEFNLKTENNVAIIPNIRNYEFGNKNEILNVYKAIINKLISLNKNVYIFKHSNDEKACKDIYDMFKNEKNVYLYLNDIDCYEYSIFIKNFEFAVSSRFHAIVHAYKEYVPCISIGWADKYEQLLRLFKQEKYNVDIRKPLNLDEILNLIESMNCSRLNEKENIKAILPSLQSENCFDILSEIVLSFL